MFQESSPSDVSQGDKAPHQKRTRVLLSCAPCRFSKLKCDRNQPCSQCEKKARIDQCVYAPKPVKKKPPPKNMTARLKRLEGLVRDMMDAEGDGQPQTKAPTECSAPALKGHVVQGEHGTAYVGATHCMAMLEDIEDLKMYFDESEEQEEGGSPPDELEAPELLLYSRGAPSNRDELVAQLPERRVADRLLMRYFSSMSPSQHIVHRPTFTRTYNRFWQDSNSVSLHWIAQLFMMLSLGIFFNKFVAPHEVEADSPIPVIDRVKHYRSCAGWALIWGKYTQPTSDTLPAFLFYIESHFMFQRAAQMNCYILSGVCIRLLLKMGLHRDPSKLANISPFEGEMRRRLWNMATQIELLVSFHMGLPSMLQGIETDVQLPLNLRDEDFDEDSQELPTSRPSSDYTAMTYPIHKTATLRIFGHIARQAHSLSPPEYSEVLKLDTLLREQWDKLPVFMRQKPLEECVGEAPMLIIQRFGLAALHSKCRCVLHRRYLAEAVPKKEHDYSRQQCIDAALTLLENQHIIWKASRNGNILSEASWFLSSLAVHDYLLAAMVVYLLIQNDNYPNPDAGFSLEGRKPPKEELKEMLKTSHAIWREVSQDVVELRRTADTLASMLAKLGCPVDTKGGVSVEPETNMPTHGSGYGSSSTGWSSSNMPQSVSTMSENESDLLSAMRLDGPNSSTGLTPFSLAQPTNGSTPAMDFPTLGASADVPTMLDFDASWMSSGDNMDWRYLDVSLAHSHTAGTNAGSGETWLEKLPLDELEMMQPGIWDQSAGLQ